MLELQVVRFILLMMRIQLIVFHAAGPRHCFPFVILSDLSIDENHILFELSSLTAVLAHDETKRMCTVITME